MYSYEDRLRAVELYIKLGNRVRLTIRQLGYPTKNALKGWYQPYARDEAMPAGYASQQRYSQAQRGLAGRVPPTAWPLPRFDDPCTGLSLGPLLAAKVQG